MEINGSLQQLIKQRDEWILARKIALKRFDESEVMEDSRFMESNRQHIESLDTLLANIEPTINAHQEEHDCE